MQIWRVAQNSSAPKRSGAVATSGMSVVNTSKTHCRSEVPTDHRAMLASSRPDAIAGGISNNASAMGPGKARAL